MLKIRLSKKCVLLGAAGSMTMRAGFSMFLLVTAIFLDGIAVTHTGVFLHPGEKLLVLLVLFLGALARLLFLLGHGNDTFW